MAGKFRVALSRDLFDKRGEPCFGREPLAALDSAAGLEWEWLPGDAWWTDELFGNIARTAIDAVLAVHAGRRPEFLVNPQALSHPRVRAWLSAPSASPGSTPRGFPR